MTPLVFAAWRVDVVQIQPIRFGIDLEMASAVMRGGDDAIHIDFIGLALADQSPGRMRENGDVTIFHGAYDAICLFLTRQIEVRVHRRHHDVQLRQARVRQVETAVLEDIDLDSLRGS